MTDCGAATGHKPRTSDPMKRWPLMDYTIGNLFELVLAYLINHHNRFALAGSRANRRSEVREMQENETH